MSSKQVLWGLVPWLLYAVFTVPEAERAGLVAALVALLWAAVAGGRALFARRAPKILELCGVAVFGTFTLIELTSGASTRDVLDDQGRGLAAATLAAVMLISAAVHPFTEQYTLADVPPTYRSSPVYRSVHRDLSIRWGCAIAVVAISYLVEADVRAAQGSDVVTFALTWLVPLVAVGVAARQSKVSGVGRRAAATASGAASAPNSRFFRSGTP